MDEIKGCEDLKPCPFCGNKDSLYMELTECLKYVQVVCGYCLARGPESVRVDVTGMIDADAGRSAVDEWNRRK